MFTLDEISLLNQRLRPREFEFWLPQMVSQHPWIVEQKNRGYGSKRLRNILVELNALCQTRFADQLGYEDWKLLQQHGTMLLERLDWAPDVYRIADLVSSGERHTTARKGISNMSSAIHKAIEILLANESLYFSTHRAYISEWEESLSDSLSRLEEGAEILIPRIPEKLLTRLKQIHQYKIYAAEECTKNHLLMLRQLHRIRS